MSTQELNDDGDCDGDYYWSWTLPSGNTLMLTVCPRSTWEENKEAQHLGNDFGCFLMESAKGLPQLHPQIIAKFASVEVAYEFADLLTRLLPEGD